MRRLSVWQQHADSGHAAAIQSDKSLITVVKKLNLKANESKRALRKGVAGIARQRGVVLLIVLGIAAGAALYFLGPARNQNGGQQRGSVEVRISIQETDPINQIDSFVPQNVSATQGTSVTFVIRNGDDEPRVFTLGAFGVNQTISPGTTARFTFVADKVGTFQFSSIATIVLFNKSAPTMVGYLTVAP